MEVIKKKKKFKLIGLDCANCAAQLENAISKMEGIESASVSFMTGKLVIECEDNDDIIMKVKKLIKKEEPDLKVEEV